LSAIVTYIRDKHALWYKFLLYLFSLAAVVFFFPGEASFKYPLEKLQDKPWNYEHLTAPFDFPVYKTKVELEEERNDIVRSAKSYFFRNQSLLNAEGLDKFIRRMKNPKAAALCREVADSILARGIIETSEVTESKKSNSPVYIIDDNVEKEYMLGDFYTLKQADDFIRVKLNTLPVNEAYALRDSIESYISVNIFYNKEFSEKVVGQNLGNILPTRGKIIKGQSIIDKGEIVTAERLNMLESLKEELKAGTHTDKSGSYLLLAGKVMVTGMCFGMMMLFLAFFRKNIFSQNSEITFIFILMVIFEVTSFRVAESGAFDLYYIPFTIAPILIRTFFDTRTALFAHLNIIIMVSFLSPEKFEFIFIQLFAGIGAIFSVAALSKRSQLFTSIIAVFFTYVLAYLSLELLLESKTSEIFLRDFIPFAISSAAVLLAYPMIYISEKVFGFVSDFTLLELSDSNSALLRELAQKAPGTFQHSLQVASLAEEAVYKVGGNPLLVRTGAMYHDIGKIRNPRFFIENMVGGVNPHEEVPYEESAKIIIQHVIDGIELAKEYKLPDQVIDFIRTHHGTTLTRYFYRHYQMEHEDEIIDEDKFRYPGPIPYSKETAVLMMADSVEAASRSLKKYDASSIDALVDGVISSQMEENQYINSDITFRDITNIKKIFKKRIMNIYHVRIEYPR
jgi:cyclic-di-AMP phosphodiesterase PgpH